VHLLVDRLTLQHPMELSSKLLRQVDQGLDDSLLQNFPERLFEGGEAEVEPFVIGSNGGQAIEVEEDEEELGEERGQPDVDEDVVPLTDTFVEHPHDCQQVVRLLLVVAEAAYGYLYSCTQETSLSTNVCLSCASTAVEE
jgi:hypothetical protein